MTYFIKQDDTFPAFTATLSDASGAVNLTQATTIKLLLKGATTLVTGVMAKVSPTAGTVSYDWQTGDTITPGDYKGEIEVTWNTGKIETFPNEDYFAVTIVPDLN